MSKVLVFGHQNPDTDAIGAAISYAALQRELRMDAEAVALGEPNEETKYALDYFHLQAPRVIEKVTDETQDVMLVDHNEFQQSVSDIAEATILSVVDHHRIANFETASPLYYRAEPVGCTSTIILKLYKEKDIAVVPEIAGIMLSAIISDTLLFKSPTCAPEDEAACHELAKIANVDLKTYGLDLLKAGRNLENKSIEELLDLDAKSFTMGDKTVSIAQVNTVDIEEVLTRHFDCDRFSIGEKRYRFVEVYTVDIEERLARQFDFDTAREKVNLKNSYSLFLLFITNILDSNSELLAIGDPVDNGEESLDFSLDKN